MDVPIIELSDVKKSFGPVSVLKGVGLAVKESLVLTRDMYTRSLTAYREKLAAIEKASPADKDKLIAQLRADAAAVQDAYGRFTSYGLNAFNPGVPENSMGAPGNRHPCK